MIVSAKDMLWKERIAQWYESGLTQSEYARQIGVAQKSISYWAYKLKAMQLLPEGAAAAVEPSAPLGPRLLAKPSLPALLPVQVGMSLVDIPAGSASTITLCTERGWTLNLPRDVSAHWLAELMRGL